VTAIEQLPTWPRRHFQQGGGDAQLFYKIHGTFTALPAISRTKYRCDGVPAGCDLQIHSRVSAPDVLNFGLEEGWIGREFRDQQPALATEVARTEHCLVLRGLVADPETLDYLRDTVGLVMALLESGGIAVFDPQIFRWWSVDEWRTRAFDPMGAVPRHHVVILVSDEPDQHGRWYHTRGMRKFGRPDISVRHVPPAQEAAVEDLCNRFIEMQAFGAVIQEGQPIKVSGLPSGWRCRHRGDLEDPDFNNVHVEIGPG
jgi:hypothetical protein